MAKNEINNVAEEIAEIATENADNNLTISEGETVDIRMGHRFYMSLAMLSTAGGMLAYGAVEGFKKFKGWASEKIDRAKEKREAKKLAKLEKVEKDV